MKKNCSVGGQAVIEGVMMRGSSKIATAVRKPNGEITTNVEEFIAYNKRNKIFSIPIIRGFIALMESLIIGLKTLNYSASFFEEDLEQSKFEKWMESKLKGNFDKVITTITLFISFAISIFLFIVIPTVVANFFKKSEVANTVVLNIIEGIIRVTIFLIYLWLIGRMEDINRVFQYHGAEHKTIFCYENEDELTPENAKKYSRFHPRCGTNFLFLVMIVSILLFSFTGWNSFIERLVYRIMLLPVVSGLTYEIIKWISKDKSILSKVIAAPGLALQKLTTREPDLQQLEVAIRALEAAEGIERYEDKELINNNEEKCIREV